MTTQAPPALIGPVTLLAKKGNLPGECIGNYDPPGERSTYLVFLPAGSKEGARVSVLLRECGKDKRAKPLYRATPAPTVYSDRWRKLPDGQLVKEVWDRSWLGQEQKTGEEKPRPPARKDGKTVTTTSYEPLWGASLSDSRVRKTTAQAVEILQEQPHDLPADSEGFGQLGFYKVAERALPSAVEELPLTDVQLAYDWPRSALWPPDAMVRVVATLATQQTWQMQVRFDAVPTWLQLQAQARYPLCGCARRRILPSGEAVAGYPRCDLCLRDEECRRCGRPAAEGRWEAGGMLCPVCEALPRQVALIDEHVAPERRAEVAAEARRLLEGRCLEAEASALTLEILTNHLEERRRQELLDRWGKYTYTYWREEGVYGSAFSPAALELFALYDQAQGEGLVSLTAWLAAGEEVKAEEGAAPRTPEAESLAKPFALAVRLRGSEAERQAAMGGLDEAIERLGKEAPEVEAVQGLLYGLAQDYGAACVALREATLAMEKKEAEARCRRETEGKLALLLAEHYPVCPLCGTNEVRARGRVFDAKAKDDEVADLLDGREIALCDCLERQRDGALAQALSLALSLPRDAELAAAAPTWQPEVGPGDGRAQAVVLRRSLAAGEVVAEAVAFHKWGRWNQVLRVYPPRFGAAPTWETQMRWRPPSAAERRALTRANYPRLEAQAQAEVEAGTAVLVELRRQARGEKGEEWVSGSRRSGVLYVVAREDERHVEAAGWYYCRLGRALVDQEFFKILLLHPLLRKQREFSSAPTSAAAVAAAPVVVPSTAQLAQLFGGRGGRR